MDSDIQIAKNLLENKTCDNCEYKKCEHGEFCFCTLYRQLDSNPYLGTEPLPEENTCFFWKENSNIAYGMFISTTKEMNNMMRKDIRSWK